MSATLNALSSDSYIDISQYRDQHFKVSDYIVPNSIDASIEHQVMSASVCIFPLRSNDNKRHGLHVSFKDQIPNFKLRI